MGRAQLASAELGLGERLGVLHAGLGLLHQGDLVQGLSARVDRLFAIVVQTLRTL
jgi:hypothetical protein